MVRFKNLMLIVPCLLAALCLINPAIAVEGDLDFNDPFVSYSADMLIEGGQGTTTSRVFHARGMDRLVQEGMALEPTVILRRDKKKIWVLFDDAKAYMEMPVDSLAGTDGFALSDMDYKLTEQGAEAVGGQKAAKYKMSATAKNGARYEGFIWLAADGITLKLDAERVGAKDNGPGRLKMELKNLRRGPQDASLFNVPPGYGLMRLPGGQGKGAPKDPTDALGN